MPQAVGQTPTVVAAPSAPHDFLMLALVTTIICGILNLLSLAFGIPAIVLAALVYMQLMIIVVIIYYPACVYRA